MAAATVSLLLGILGNILSILVFSSPLRTFWRIYKRRSTEDFKGLPYICTLLSTSLWTYYGLIKPGGTLILTINAAGTAFQSFYLIVFLIYAPKQRKRSTFLLALIMNGVCFGVIMVATLVSTKGSRRVFIVGAICSTISVSMYASPLVALIPNAIGFVLGGVQLALYVYYRNFGNLAMKDDDNKEKLIGGKVLYQELEMGRSVSLPKQLALLEKKNSLTTLPKHQSLPIQIIRASSTKLNELLNFLQDNDPINIHPKHENGIKDEALVMNKAQNSL